MRDPERWYDSAFQTIYFVRDTLTAWVGHLLPRTRAFVRMIDRIIWKGMFQGRFADRSLAIEAFNRHNEQVRRDVSADRLLVYEVRQGWEPLCAFLGVPVPEGKPFPHVNDAIEFRSRAVRDARIMRVIGYAAVGVAVLAVVLIAAAFRLAS